MFTKYLYPHRCILDKVRNGIGTLTFGVGPMFRSAIVTLVLIFMAFVQRLPADAQSGDYQEICANESAIYFFEFSVEACTSLIQEANKSPTELAVLLSFRCRDYISGEQSDRAIQDCDEAIWLDRKNSLAYEIRGLAFQQTHRYQSSVADFLQAISLQPSSVRAWEGLCRSQLSLSQARLEISACKEALRLRSVDKK